MNTVRITACALLMFSCNVFASTVVEDNNLTFAPDGTLGDYRASIFQDAAAQDITSAWFDYDSGTFNFGLVDINLDEGSDWYLVNTGDEFSTQTIGSGQFPVIFEVKNFQPLPRPPVFVGADFDNFGFGDFYLGVTTGQGFVGPDPNRDVFGWALIRSSSSGLELIDNAIAYGGGGIIVGTSIIIPEPSSIALSVFVLSPLMIHGLRCGNRA